MRFHDSAAFFFRENTTKFKENSEVSATEHLQRMGSHHEDKGLHWNICLNAGRGGSLETGSVTMSP